MPRLLHFFLLPLLLLIAIPLCTFALITITTSVILLVLRVVLVYLELGIALIRVHFSPLTWSPFHPGLKHGSKASSPPRTNATPNTGRRKSGPLTPKVEPVLSSLIPGREFEGIGGWRDENPDDPEDEYNWLNMNSRLELISPSLSQTGRRHRRARTSGGLTLTIPAHRSVARSPGHTPVQLGPSTRMTPVTAPAFNIKSPEDYFTSSAKERPQASAELCNIGRARRVASLSSSSVRDLSMTSGESERDGAD